MFRWKIYKSKFLRFKFASRARKFNRNIFLPKPVITRRMKSLFMARKLYALILDKLGLSKFKFLSRFQGQRKRDSSRRFKWNYIHNRMFFKFFYARRPFTFKAFHLKRNYSFYLKKNKAFPLKEDKPFNLKKNKTFFLKKKRGFYLGKNKAFYLKKKAKFLKRKKVDDFRQEEIFWKRRKNLTRVFFKEGRKILNLEIVLRKRKSWNS